MKTNNRFYLYSIFYMLGVFLLTACGGGGGSGGGGVTDTTAPTAAITFPAENSLTEGNTVTVHGRAEDSESEITVVRVNGVDATSSDNFANWQVTVPLTRGQNILQVETGNIALNSNMNAAQVAIEASDPLIVRAQAVVLDSANDRYLVLDLNRKAIIAVDINSGERTIISDNSTPDGLNQFSNSGGALELDSASNRLLTLVPFVGLIAVDLNPGPNMGKRTIISNSSIPNDINPFSAPSALVLDSANNRVLVADQGSNASILAVDLTDGARTILSNDTTPFINNPFDRPVALALDSANKQLFVVDRTLSRVFSVDLNPGPNLGKRTTLSDNTTPNAVNPLSGPMAVVLDNANNRLLVGDASNNVIAVDLNPGADMGARTVLSNNFNPDNNNPFNFIAGLVLDDARSRLLVVNEGASVVHGVNLDHGGRTILSQSHFPNTVTPFLNPLAIELDSANNQLLVADGRAGILAVDLSSGARTIVSNQNIPDSSNELSNPVRMVLDSSNNRLLVVDSSLDAVIAVDLNAGPDRGKRTIISDSATPDAVNPFVSPLAIVLDSANNRLLIGDAGLDVVIAVDLNVGPQLGKRTIISDRILPVGAFSIITDLALDSANNRLLMTDSTQGAVFAVNLTPGTDMGVRTILSDNMTPDNANPFFKPRAVALDTINNRLLVTDRTGVLSVDLTTGANLGARTPVSNNSAPDDVNAFIVPADAVLDSTNNQLLVLEGGVGLRAIIAVNLNTGERVILSR